MERLLEGFFCVNSDFFYPKFRDSQPVRDAYRPTHQIPTGARPTTNARFFASKTHKHIMLKAVVIIIIVLCPSFIFLNWDNLWWALFERLYHLWEEEDDKVGAVRSWSCKLATQHKSPVTAFIFIFIFVFVFGFCFYSFFLLLFLPLLFLFSVSTAVVSVSHLLFVSVCIDSFEFFFYVSEALSRDLHWVRRKFLIFELKMAKCFSH